MSQTLVGLDGLAHQHARIVDVIVDVVIHNVIYYGNTGDRHQ